jgi:integrase
MKGREVVVVHRDNTKRQLETLAKQTGFTRLADLKREALERWLANESGKGRSARSRNAHRTALVSFANWCISAGRLTANPFKGVPNANEAVDPRRRRRAMTEAELIRLLDVASRRPLLEAQTVRRGARKGEVYGNVRDEVRSELEATGRERSLVYKTLILTGLRKNELATLTVAQVRFDAPTPFIDLDAADEKSREGNGVVIRADLAGDLQLWLDDKLESIQSDARRCGIAIPARLPGNSLVSNVPRGLVRIFDRDLKAAGIAKRDDRGRTLDVHALRTTFGTHLSKGGVSLRTAQAAMRHSDPSLTANVYTDPRLLDVSGALDSLPSLSLAPHLNEEKERTLATGTGSYVAPPVALLVAERGDKRGESLTIGVKMNSPDLSLAGADSSVASVSAGKGKRRLTTPGKHSQSIGAAGFEPTTSRPPV